MEMIPLPVINKKIKKKDFKQQKFEKQSNFNEKQRKKGIGKKWSGGLEKKMGFKESQGQKKPQKNWQKTQEEPEQIFKNKNTLPKNAFKSQQQ